MSGECFTSAEAHFCAAHESALGRMHGHTYVVCATWPDTGMDALIRKRSLDDACKEFDHAVLPESLTRAEAIAAYLGRLLGASRVEVRREREGLSASWVAS